MACFIVDILHVLLALKYPHDSLVIVFKIKMFKKTKVCKLVSKACIINRTALWTPTAGPITSTNLEQVAYPSLMHINGLLYTVGRVQHIDEPSK